jgi:hypothetical protein
MMRSPLWIIWVLAGMLVSCDSSKTVVVAEDAGFLIPRAQCLDNDGDGRPGTGECDAEPVVDCDDNDPRVHPGAVELCNGRDENCDGVADEALATSVYYRDADGDGFGTLELGAGCMAPDAGAVAQAGDCNDSDATIHPGQPEVCNATDDDCDGEIDDGPRFQDFFIDADGDGAGNRATPPVRSCAEQVSGHVLNSDDCDDAKATVKPGGLELCNNVDDDCDGRVDDDVTYSTYFPDRDSDGYGAAGSQGQRSCDLVAGKVPNDFDCDDSAPAVKPQSAEICNAIDDNCDGRVDEGLRFATYFPDADGDGFGAAGSTPVSSCVPLAGKTTNQSDCNDGRSEINPGVLEVCNGIDDNCTGGVDEGLTFEQYFVDGDGDGYGSGSAQVSCTTVAGRVTTPGDCNDGNPTIKPSAQELCNGIDDNCSGRADEGLTTSNYFPDGDGDGHGQAGSTPTASCAAVAGRVTSSDDCDDANRNVHPGRSDTCNELDDDCDGIVDNGGGPRNYYPDVDGDEYGAATAVPVRSCTPVVGRVTDHSDCNDAAVAINPRAAERCNGVDDNCNAQVDEGNPESGASCVTGQPGMCAEGVRTCNAGSVLCVAQRSPAAERCNGADDDCDGVSDEDFGGLGQSCSSGGGACARSGTIVCSADGAAAICNAVGSNPTAPACDGIDNDCDGVIDEPVLTSTNDLAGTTWQDLEVQPYYYSSGSCSGGRQGTGTDALTAAGLVLSGSASGIGFVPLGVDGVPTSAVRSVTDLGYTEVAMAQAGDGFFIAGLYSNNVEVDLYYVSAKGDLRHSLLTQFRSPEGCSPGNCRTLDSLRVVRGNGKRVNVLWHEAGVGIKLIHAEPCSSGSSWTIRPAGCGTTGSILTIASAPNGAAGLGADSAMTDWTDTQTCESTGTLRRLSVAYLASPTNLKLMQINEDGAGSSAPIDVVTVTSPRTLAEPDVAWFRDSSGAGQSIVAYTTKDPGATTPQSDVNYWLTSDPTWHYTYEQPATASGVASIERPRVSVGADHLLVTAIRHVGDPSGFKKQVMTRRLSLNGVRSPLGSAVEFPVTAGGCSEAVCRPGDKIGVCASARFSRIYYGATGGTSAGSFASALSCN